MTPKRHVGRPSLPYDPEAAALICEELATSAKGIEAICADDSFNLPSARVVHKWLATTPEFQQAYAHAKDKQADFLFNEIVEIADRPLVGVIEESGEDERGGHTKTVRRDNVERARLMIDARKWVAAKLKPKKYGDKLDVEHSGGVILQHAIPRPVRE